VTAEDRSVWASTDEYNLIAHLFEQQEYNRFFRPVRNKSEVIYVSFEMALIQIITLVRLALAHKVQTTTSCIRRRPPRYAPPRPASGDTYDIRHVRIIGHHYCMSMLACQYNQNSGLVTLTF